MRTPQPKTQPSPQDQGGQSLATIIMLGAILAFFGAALTRMLLNEAKQVVETKKRDKLFTAGDAALQRSLGVLLQSDSNWNAPQSLANFNSLSWTAFTDIPGMTYYIKVMPGTLEDQAGVGAADDTAVMQWVNVGSLTHDRTIFVRAIDHTTKQEDRFFTTVHRTPKNYHPGTKGIQAGGCINTAGWDGTTVDTTGSTCATPGPTPTPVPCAEGSVQAECVSSPDFCLEVDRTSPGVIPTVVVPIGQTIPVPGAAMVTSDRSYNADTSFGCLTCTVTTTVRYQVNNLAFGAKDFTFNAQAGPIEIYVTGTLTISGNAKFIVNTGTAWTCCKSKGLTIFVKGSGDVTWNGTPDGNFLLYAPESDFTLNGTGNKTFVGAIIAKNVGVNGGGSGTFKYDKCLAARPAADNYEAPPLVTTQWQQIGKK
jgi:hypothetical protein